MNVKSLAGTSQNYVVGQARRYEGNVVHFQFKSTDNSNNNREYGFAIDIPHTQMWSALGELNGPQTTSLATDKTYHFIQARPKDGKLHVQVLDGQVNRKYGGAFDLELPASLKAFLEEELESNETPEAKYVAQVLQAV